MTAARAPGPTCEFTDSTLFVEGGAIDLAASGAASSYFQIFGWENDLENISVTVTQQITTETPNTFVATTIKDSYVMVGGASPPPGLVSISATIAPGGTPQTNTVGVFLLTQQAIQTICGAPTALENCPGIPAGSPSETLNVTFQIAGALVGGGAAQTNPITFPLTLFNNGGTKPADPLRPGIEPWVCAGTNVPVVSNCGIPGRDVAYCVPPP